MSLKDYMEIQDKIAKLTARIESQEKLIASLVAQIDQMNLQAVKRARKPDAQ